MRIVKKFTTQKREKDEFEWLKKKFPDIINPNTDMGELGSIEPYLRKVSQCDGFGIIRV